MPTRRINGFVSLVLGLVVGQVVGFIVGIPTLVALLAARGAALPELVIGAAFGVAVWGATGWIVGARRPDLGWVFAIGLACTPLLNSAFGFAVSRRLTVARLEGLGLNVAMGLIVLTAYAFGRHREQDEPPSADAAQESFFPVQQADSADSRQVWSTKRG